MNDYTQEEIEEMRKRLPFKAVVWDDEDNPYSQTVAHIFDDGRCATSIDTWMCFKEVKEPGYEPFTIDDWEQFADEWVKMKGSSIKIRPVSICEKGIDFGTDSCISFKILFKQFEFAKNGKPFGKEVKQ